MFYLSRRPSVIRPNFAAAARSVFARPPIAAALPQQLGLTLTAQTGPVEYLVIDHVERPAEPRP